MKTANELASAFLTSPAEQKRQGLAMKRLAGGLRAAVERKEMTGLSEKEVRTLHDAILVLNKLADNHAAAQKISQKKRDDRAAAEVKVRAGMRDNFDTLYTIADRIALIAAVQRHLLRDHFVVTLDDLQYHFKDSINSLAYELSKKAITVSAAEVVKEAWEKFTTHREKLQDQYSSEIVRLTRAAEVAPNNVRT
jgi:hypothetical protein